MITDESPSSPPGYVLSGRFSPNSLAKNLGSLVLFIVFLFALLSLNLLLRPDFNAGEFVRQTFVEAKVFRNVGMTLVAIAIIWIYGFVHEALHGGAFWIFTKKRPNFGMKGLNLYTVLPIGVYCMRNKTIVAALSPLTVITILCLIFWLIVPLVVVPIMILLISVNIAACISDILQFRWLLRFSSRSLYGFDGQYSVVYEPQDVSHK